MARAAQADAAPPVTPVLLLRMRPALGAQLRGKAIARIPMPRGKLGQNLKPSARLFLQEFNGGPTGRADLVSVIGPEAEGAECLVARGWCWGSGKMDDDLTAFGYTTIADDSAILEALQ